MENNGIGTRTTYGDRSRLSRIELKSIIILLCLAAMLVVYEFIPINKIVLRTWLSSSLSLGMIWGYLFLSYGKKIPIRTDVLLVFGFSFSNLLPPLYLSFRSSTDWLNVADMYPLVAFLTVIGVMALLFGYGITENRTKVWKQGRFSPLKPQLNHAIFVVMVLALVVVWFARLILLFEGAYYWAFKNFAFLYGRWYSSVDQISKYGLIVPIIVWLMVDQNPRWRKWAWIITIAELLWVLPSGSRFSILMVISGLLLVAWWRRDQFPKKEAAILFFVFLMMMPILGEYRYTIGEFSERNRLKFETSKKAFSSAYKRFVRISEKRNLLWIDPVVSRFYDGQYFSFLLKHYRQNYNWEYGKTYYTRLPFIFLPYFLYTDRPTMQVPIDNWFDLIKGGSAPSTFLGEAYINFGYSGIPIMTFLLGILMGCLDKVFRRLQYNLIAVAAYLLLGSKLPFMVTQSFSDLLGFIRNIILLGALIFLMTVFVMRMHLKGMAESYTYKKG